jgi:hypothetical protein
MRVTMNVSGASQTALQALNETDATSNVRANLQIALLKKSLQSQQDQAEEMMKMLSGKGQTLDIRV